jgi:hypothetical protein
MSRSYRKPIFTDGYGTKRRRLAKARANRRVRRMLYIPSGNAYRKFSDPWDICDYRIPEWAPPVEDQIRHIYGRIHVEPLEKLLRDYGRSRRK